MAAGIRAINVVSEKCRNTMKILLANKFYYRRGGDCIYMLNLEKLLKAHGHEVAVFAMDYPENLDTPWKKYFPKNMSKLMAFTRRVLQTVFSPCPLQNYRFHI